MTVHCTRCGDEFDPTESSDRLFCSWDCEEVDGLESAAYTQARHGGASVF